MLKEIFFFFFYESANEIMLLHIHIDQANAEFSGFPRFEIIFNNRDRFPGQVVIHPFGLMGKIFISFEFKNHLFEIKLEIWFLFRLPQCCLEYDARTM